MSTASRLVSALGRMLRRGRAAEPSPSHGAASTSTFGVDPHRVSALTLDYAPDRDGHPDAGEIVWTWVPYEENDGRGKDRPVLVLGRHSADRVYAVRLTSSPPDRDRDYLPLGAGEWDAAGRPSWVDLEHLYSVHARGMRREAAALDEQRFLVVVDALSARYGWHGGRR